MKLKKLLTCASLIALSACSSSSDSGSDKKGGNVDPELQKPAKESRTEDFTCDSEETMLIQENKGETYYQFTKSSSKGTRHISVFENNVERSVVTNGTHEVSWCISYQDHCNQTWSNRAINYTSDSVIRRSNPKPNHLLAEMKGTDTSTLISTDDEDSKRDLNKPITKSLSFSSLKRVDGNKRYTIELSQNGKSVKMNESEVTVINDSGSYRTENTTTIKPIRFNDSESTMTIVKGFSNCTISKK